MSVTQLFETPFYKSDIFESILSENITSENNTTTHDNTRLISTNTTTTNNAILLHTNMTTLAQHINSIPLKTSPEIISGELTLTMFLDENKYIEKMEYCVER